MTRVLAYLALALWLPVAAAAQDDDDGPGFLARLIQDNLSGAGRDVRIRGFEGALSSRATLDELTIADDEGVWLTLRGAVLDWNRSALLGGRLEINALEAEELLLPRLPAAGEPGVEPPARSASGFRLPELPVSVSIGTLAIGRAELGAPLLGTAAAVSLDGSLSLAGGEGEADLAIERVDGRRGRFAIDAGFVNETEALDLEIALSEAADGIAANLIGLPGRPSVDMSVDGTGTLADFTADLRIATDGAERLAGDVTLLAETAADGAVTRRFRADIGGDIAPVLAPDYRPFFGDDIRLAASGARFPDGRTVIDGLRLTARAVTLEGTLAIGADGLPERIDVTGEIADAGGDPVLLPAGGPETRIDRAELDIEFDAAAGERWTGVVALFGLDRPGLAAEELRLDGDGVIRSAAGARSVTANLEVEGDGVAFSDPDVQEALGSAVTGRARIAWEEGAPIRFDGVRVIGAGYRIAGSGEVAGADRDLTVAGQATAEIDDLAPFSGLAGRPLAGAVAADLSGSAEALGGAFEVTLSGRTTDLAVGIAEVDRLMAGETGLRIAARRDAAGTVVETLTLENPQIAVDGSAALTEAENRIDFEARLAETGQVLAGLSGPTALEVAALGRTPDLWEVEITADTAGATRLSLDGLLERPLEAPSFVGNASVASDDLSVFSALAGRPLGGAVTASLAGSAVATGETFDVDLSARTRDLAVGIAEADALMAGASTLRLVARRDAAGIVVERLDLANPQIVADGSGALTDSENRIDLEARLAETGRVLPGLSGPTALDLSAVGRTRETWDVDLRASTAGATRLTLDGVLEQPLGAPAFEGDVDFSSDDLSVFSDLAGRRLGGALSVDATGRVASDPLAYRISATVESDDLRVGQPEADRLLAGDGRIVAALEGDAESVDIDRLTVETGALRARASGRAGTADTAVEFGAQLSDLGLVAPGISGPLSVNGRVGRQGAAGAWQVRLAATGPAESTARVEGSLAPDFATANLDITGRAPLALAGRFISPNSVQGTLDFDLGLNGAPGLSALTGTLRTAGARVVIPSPGIVLEALEANVGLGGGRANVSAGARVEGGGRVSLNGPVTLSPPFSGQLVARLQGVVVSDPALYRTTVDGEITATGPLGGGATIAGTVRLGQTDVQVPSTGLGGTGAIPDLRHVNEPAAVRATRSRAGLIDSGNGGDGSRRARPYPLDLTILAENRIFVRGRGLDAELGGRLDIGGTTAQVVPSGQFDLIRGRLDILGKRLTLDEGFARLEGAFAPFVRLVATNRSDDVTIRVVIEGPASAPEISFVSEPELPEDEVLARLLFDRSIDEISPLQAAQLASAVATLAGRGGEGVIGRLRRNFGLDDLDVTTDGEGNTAVRAGRYLSENVYTDVVVGSDTSEINLNLDITPNVTARGSLKSTGETGVGIFFQRDY